MKSNPYDPEGDHAMETPPAPSKHKIVYAVLPKDWDPDRFWRTINAVCRKETGFPMFYQTPDGASFTNEVAGADPEKFDVVSITMELEE